MRLAICQKCENQIAMDLTTVNCRVGKLCCGGSLSQGSVDLRSGKCNLNKWPSDLFDRVMVISLKRRPDRLAQFWKNLESQSWPFKKPEVFNAIDGNKVPVPAGIWKAGGGAWGCMQSHRRILEDAMMDDVKNLLILEDDAEPVPNFATKVAGFLEVIPADWDGIMLGGQHFGPPTSNPSPIRKCTDCQRTHAYAVRGRYLRDLYAMWQSYSGHCDHAMGPFMKNYNVYSPEPFLIGQGRNQSDISGRFEPVRFWSGNDPRSKVAIINCPRNVIDDLRLYGVHTGYTRNPNTGTDVGLQAILDSTESLTNKKRQFRIWLDMLRIEASAFDINLLGIWAPNISEELVQLSESGVGEELLTFKCDSLNQFKETYVTNVDGRDN